SARAVEARAHALDPGQSVVRNGDGEARGVERLVPRAVPGDHGLERVTEMRADADFIEGKALNGGRAQERAECAAPCELAHTLPDKCRQSLTHGIPMSVPA